MERLTRRRFLRGAATAGVALAAGGLFASCQHQTVLTTESSRKVARLGFLALTSADDYAPCLSALRASLRDLGYAEEHNLVIEPRFADGREELLPDLADDLVRRKVDVLVTAATQASLAAKQATNAIPIVFANSGDPIGAGLVASLARPGGNITGLSSLNRELAGKRLELLKTAAPGISRVAVLWADAAERDVNETRTSAFWLGLQTEELRVVRAADLHISLQAALDRRADALVAISTPLINSFNEDIARFTALHRLPSISEQREFAFAGGLMSYGANVVQLFQHAAVYVDKILSGANPADLPVERAERFELAINLWTAQSLGLLLPQSLLLQATEVVS
jgi:putative tryptophan/tyrosine transport system substrate-binding protein